MESKHTKEKWEIVKDHFLLKNECSAIIAARVGEKHKVIAKISDFRGDNFERMDSEEHEANIKIMAAGAELLECTQRLLIDLIFSLGNQGKALGWSDEKITMEINNHPVVIRSREAIKKATT